MSHLIKIEQEETELKHVPQCYWAYVAHNGRGDGLGTWSPDRNWILTDMSKYPNTLAYNVVDGRNKENIRKYIGTSWSDDGGACKVKDGEIVMYTIEDWDMEWKQWLVAADLKCLKI